MVCQSSSVTSSYSPVSSFSMYRALACCGIVVVVVRIVAAAAVVNVLERKDLREE